MTISGPGSLDVTSNAYGIEIAFQNILLNNCGDVTVKAPYGMCGALSFLSYVFDGTPTSPLESLGIANSNLTIESVGEESAAPIIFYGMELDENSVQVVEPKSWKFQSFCIYDTSSGSDVLANRFVVKRKNLKGDVNTDGKVDISDIVAVINQIAGTATYPYPDVNNDSKVDISDIVAIINIIAGM